MATKKTGVSSEVYVCAAKTRALLISHLNNSNSKQTVREIGIALADKLSSIGVTKSTVSFQLKRLSASDLIGVANRGNAKEYFRKNSQQNSNIALIASELPSTKQLRKLHGVSSAQQSILSIDIVKSTGKVRINMNNIIIEIGIID